MIQCGGSFGFLYKARFAFRIGDSSFGQNFDGDHTIKAEVTGFVDHTHTTLAQFFEDLEVRQLAPWRNIWHGFPKHTSSLLATDSVGRETPGPLLHVPKAEMTRCGAG
jgi:hypothetical protein